jgi:hypothetical protein
MSRGIHLKQLTSTDLRLIGVAETDPDPAPAGEPIGDAGSTGPSAALSHQAGDAKVTGQGPRPHAGPPANPKARGEHEPAPTPPGPDEPPDLAELTREIRRELEDTLRLLETGPYAPQL